MKRKLIQMAKTFVPGKARVWMRSRVEESSAKLGTDSDVEAGFKDAGDYLVCTVGDASFRAPKSAQPDLEFFCKRGDGRAELISICREARAGGILFDVGAHLGLISTLFCAARPENTAFSFEPSPFLVTRLEEIKALNNFQDKMFVQPCALGESVQQTSMVVDPVGGYVQSQHYQHSMLAAPETITVQVETLASASERLKVVPDFVKLDVEGYELEVIKGSQEFLARTKPVLFFELHLSYLEEKGVSPKTVVDLLSSCGYNFFSTNGHPLPARKLYDSPLPVLRCLARAN